MSRYVAGIITGLLACAGLPAMAQTYNYTAKTDSAVLKSGKVTAGSLVWDCSGNTCRISGPWPSPGLSACQQLAAQVGRLSEYGHPKAKLSASQMSTCNKSAASASTSLAINPNVLNRGKIVNPGPIARIPNQKIPPIARIPTPAPTPTTSPTSTPPAPSAEVFIEEGSYQDYTLYVGATQSMKFTGSYTGAHPAISGAPATVRWSGSAIRVPAIRHTGTDDPAERIVSVGSSPADAVYSERASGLFVEVPIQLSNIPQRVATVRPSCTLGAVSNATNSHAATYPYNYQIGFAEGSYWRRDVVDGDWSLNVVARLPVIFRPMMEQGDIHAVACDVQLMVSRVATSGVDQVSLIAASEVGGVRFLPGMAPASGTTSNLRSEVNVGD